MQTYDGDSWDDVRGVVRAADGGYVLLGVSSTIGQWEDTVLLKTDPAGNEIWRQAWRGPLYEDPFALAETTDGGFVLTGSFEDWMSGRKDADAFLIKTDEAGNEVWRVDLGGTDFTHVAHSVAVLPEGGYLLTGLRYSSATGREVFLLKTDDSGTELWQQTFGPGSGDAVIRSSDGGFVIVGVNRELPPARTILLIKTDSDGNETWRATFPDATYDDRALYDVTETSDGGFVITGGADPSGTYSDDLVLVKTDASGTELWTKTFGGQWFDVGRDVSEMADGGLFVVGQSGSDVYMLKTDADGIEQWSRTVDYGYADSGNVCVPLPGGNVVVGGRRGSDLYLGSDMLLFEIDSAGVTQWDSAFDDRSTDRGDSFHNTADGGFIISGHTESNPYLLKTDPSGAVVWRKSYPDSPGGYWSGWRNTAVIQTPEGGYLFMAREHTTQFNEPRAALIKTDTDGSETWRRFFSYLDSGYALLEGGDGSFVFTGTSRLNTAHSDVQITKYDSGLNHLWSKRYGSNHDEASGGMAETADGGYVVTGTTYGPQETDFLLLKVDGDGNEVWFKTYAASGDQYAHDVIQTAEGGWIIAGKTGQEYSLDESDTVLKKVDPQGNLLWSRTYDFDLWDGAVAVEQTADGGFVVGGSVGTGAGGYPSDIHLFKVDADGTTQWRKAFGESRGDFAADIIVRADAIFATGGYLPFDSDGGNTRTDAFLLSVPLHDVNIAVQGTGSGRVTSSPVGIDCGTDCMEILPDETRVTLTATPDVFSIFTGWTGDPDCSNGIITADADRNCTAAFELNPVDTSENDFDGSGGPDMLWRHHRNGLNALAMRVRPPSLGKIAFMEAEADSAWYVGAISDFNLDGFADILWHHRGAGSLSVWYMSGTNILNRESLGTLSPNWRIAGAADFDRNGKTDVLLRHRGTGAAVLAYLDGLQRTGLGKIAPRRDMNWRIDGIGDFNRDGRPDILWRNQKDVAAEVWFIADGKKIGEGRLPQIPGAWLIEQTADFDGDSSPDLVLRNHGTGANAVLYLDGITKKKVIMLPSITDPDWFIEG